MKPNLNIAKVCKIVIGFNICILSITNSTLDNIYINHIVIILELICNLI